MNDGPCPCLPAHRPRSTLPCQTARIPSGWVRQPSCTALPISVACTQVATTPRPNKPSQQTKMTAQAHIARKPSTFNTPLPNSTQPVSLDAVAKLYRAAHIGCWHPNSHDPPSRCTTNPSKNDGHRPKNYQSNHRRLVSASADEKKPKTKQKPKNRRSPCCGTN